MDTLAQAQQNCLQMLLPLYGEQESLSIACLLLMHITGYNRTGLLLNHDQVLNEMQDSLLKKLLPELRTARPLQYVIGETEFDGYPILVDEAVLIPRPETEELLAWLLIDYKAKKHPNKSPVILDACSGSACIAIALKKHLPLSTVLACDISLAALKVAERNLARNQVAVELFQADVLADDFMQAKPDASLDAIICNPPYVRNLEKAYMWRNVLEFEPHLALFVPDDDPLLFYRHIAGFAVHKLKAGGSLYVEINEALGKETQAVFQSAGLTNIQLRQDSFGKDRFVKAVRAHT